jgi:hypothetical protein
MTEGLRTPGVAIAVNFISCLGLVWVVGLTGDKKSSECSREKIDVACVRDLDENDD